METSVYPPASHHHHQQPHQLPSPTSHVSSSSSSNGQTTPLTPNSPYPTTFVQADTASFKQVVQMLTGSPRPRPTTTTQPDPPVSNRSGPHHHSIPPIKSIPNKKASNSSGFKLYERRNSLKNFKINPIFAPGSGSGSGSGCFSPGDILSPSILDFPSLALSPVTPLVPDPFPSSDEEKAIKEKGFYLHPSPATTPRDSSGGSEPPRLLPLFPVTSPRVSSEVLRPSRRPPAVREDLRQSEKTSGSPRPLLGAGFSTGATGELAFGARRGWSLWTSPPVNRLYFIWFVL